MAGAERLVVGRRVTLLDELEAEALREVPRRSRVALLRLATSHVAANVPEVVAALAALGVAAASAAAGDPLLVAARTQGSLWRLGREGDRDLTPLRGEGARAWNTAARVAARYLPVLGADLDRKPPPAGFVPLGPLPDDAVDGPSFGASFVLAHASAWMGIPIDEDLAASAEVDEHGALHPVDGVKQKLAALRSRAPGVRRLIVARGQTDAVDTPELRVIEASSALDVIRAGFTRRDHPSWLLSEWRKRPAHARQLARHLFRQTVRGRASHSNWSAVATTAALLESVPDLGAQAIWDAEVVRAIAARHCGGAASPIPPWPPGLRPPRPLRLELLAHEVQAANDRCDEGWRELVDAALAELADPDHAHPEDLKLLGAVGRCLAAWGRWDEARGCLRQAIAGWYRFDEHAEASYAAGELVRVEGLTGSETSLAEVIELAQAFLHDPRTSDTSRAYFALAEGRAWITLGDRQRGLAALDRAPLGARHDNAGLDASIRRWRRKAGETEPTAARVPVPNNAVLVRIDEGDEPAAAEFGSVDAAQWQRCQRVDPEGGVARWLAMFPY